MKLSNYDQTNLLEHLHEKPLWCADFLTDKNLIKHFLTNILSFFTFQVVNVYRLITRNTIEEKILGLQKFKMITANTVISSDNASLHSMATDQIFDLFSLQDDPSADDQNGARDQQRQQQQGIKALLDNMPELWDDRQYEDEYDLNTYMNKKHASNGKEHASLSLESPSTSKDAQRSNNQTLNWQAY